MWKYVKVSGCLATVCFVFTLGRFIYSTSLKASRRINVSSGRQTKDAEYLRTDLHDTGQAEKKYLDDLVFENSPDNVLIVPEKSPSYRKYLVYSCSGKSHCGGWGDRLRGMFSTYVMAHLTNRIFVINMTSPCPLTTLLRPNEILWNAEVDEESRKDEIFVQVHDNERFAKMLQVLDLSEFFKQHAVKICPNFDLYYRLKLNLRYQNKLSELEDTPSKSISLVAHFYKKLFILKHELQFQASEFISKLYENGKRRTLVCFQVRMGRNPSIPRDTEVKTKPSELDSVWHFLDEFSDVSRYKIFVTTDSEGVRNEAKRRFPKQILDTPGPIMHPDYPHGNDSCPSMSKVILDQYLLRYCNTLVVSKSVFGVMGALIRDSSINLYQFTDGKIKKKSLSDFRLFAI